MNSKVDGQTHERFVHLPASEIQTIKVTSSISWNTFIPPCVLQKVELFDTNTSTKPLTVTHNLLHLHRSARLWKNPCSFLLYRCITSELIGRFKKDAEIREDLRLASFSSRFEVIKLDPTVTSQDKYRVSPVNICFKVSSAWGLWAHPVIPKTQGPWTVGPPRIVLTGASSHKKCYQQETAACLLISLSVANRRFPSIPAWRHVAYVTVSLRQALHSFLPVSAQGVSSMSTKPVFSSGLKVQIPSHVNSVNMTLRWPHG